MPLHAVAAHAGFVGRADHPQQAMKRRIRMNHAWRMTTLASLNQRQTCGGIGGDRLDATEKIQHVILRRHAACQHRVELLRVVVELLEQHRRKIHHGAHRWIPFEVRGHVAIVLDTVQIHPG